MLKILIKNLFQLFGFQVSRLPTEAQKKRITEKQQQAIDAEKLKKQWLKNRQIQTILDIGANTGQFAVAIRELFPETMIYSFEPLKDCYEELITNFQGDQKFQAFNVGLGDRTEEVEIYHNQFSPSSSLLPMKSVHQEAFPQTRHVAIEKVKIVCLDEIVKELALETPVLIKLDVQGYEDKVIAGGISTISSADTIITEMSIEPMYETQPLFHDIYQSLVELGFEYRGNYEQLDNPADGRILQVDGVFIKRES